MIEIPSVSVTVAEALACGSAWLMAVMVMVPGDGMAFGAVYVAVAAPFGETVPSVELPPIRPFTSHITLAFEVPVTVA